MIKHIIIISLAAASPARPAIAEDSDGAGSQQAAVEKA